MELKRAEMERERGKREESERQEAGDEGWKLTAARDRLSLRRLGACSGTA